MQQAAANAYIPRTRRRDVYFPSANSSLPLTQFNSSSGTSSVTGLTALQPAYTPQYNPQQQPIPLTMNPNQPKQQQPQMLSSPGILARPSPSYRSPQSSTPSPQMTSEMTQALNAHRHSMQAMVIAPPTPLPESPLRRTISILDNPLAKHQSTIPVSDRRTSVGTESVQSFGSSVQSGARLSNSNMLKSSGKRSSNRFSMMSFLGQGVNRNSEDDDEDDDSIDIEDEETDVESTDNDSNMNTPVTSTFQNMLNMMGEFDPKSLAERPFLSSDIQSFAIYCPGPEEDLSSLYQKIGKWNAVDLLIVPLVSLQNGSFNVSGSGSANGGAGMDSGDSAGRVRGESNPLPLRGKLSNQDIGMQKLSGLEAGRPRGLSNPQVPGRNKVMSVASMFSSKGLAIEKLVDMDMDNSPNSLNKLFAARSKYLIAMVDLDDLYNAFKAHRGALMNNFSNYVLNHIASGIINLSCPITGFLLKASPRLSRKIQNNEVKIIRIIRALRQRWKVTKTPPVVLLTDFGLAIWDTVRDWISGLVLHDMLMDPFGNMKIRFTSERLQFEEKMRLLKGEIALRSDFCVLGIEAVESGPVELSHEFKRHIMSWYSSFGFKFWICHFRQFSEISDIRPFPHTELGSDMLEIATAPSLKNCRNTAETLYLQLIDSGLSPQLDQEIWRQVFREVNLPKVFLDACRAHMLNVTAGDFVAVTYDRRPFPLSPRYSQFGGVLRFIPGTITEENVKGHIRSQATQTDLMTTNVAVTSFGYSYGQQRCDEVASLVLTVLFQLKEKNLLAAFRYNNDLGSDKDAFSQTFTSAITLFENIVERPTPATQWLLELLDHDHRDKFIRDLKNLVANLKLDSICIYFAKKAAFIPKETIDFPYKFLWAVTHEEANVLYIFISDSHPSIEEAIIHAYMKHVNGWTTKRCVLLEAIVNAKKCEDQDFPLPVPSRICQEIDGSYRSNWLDLIRNTESEIRTIQRAGIAEREKAYLVELSYFISQRAEYLLVEKERFTDLMLQRVATGFVPKDELESRLVKFMGLQTLNKEGIELISSISAELDRAMIAISQRRGHEQHLFAICFLVFVMYKACRRCAFMELEVAIQDLSTAFLPDKDQVAVSLEMSTTQTNMQDIFNLSSLQLATAFHERVRNRMREAEQEQEEQALRDGEQFSAKNIDFSVAKYLGNAYIYVYPIMIDFILSNIIGSGIFFSDRMSEETLEAATLAFLVALLISTMFMLLRYSTIVNQFLRWPENVKITETKEIEAWFGKIIPRPQQKPEEKQDVYDKRVRLWERCATELFASRMQVAIKRSSFLKNQIIKARVAQWRWERPLMTWFMERSGLDPSTVKPFSPKWDSLAKQGVDELKKKYQTEKINRGALLYVLEAPAIVFGFLYFIIIFMDKWALLLANRSLRSFLPNVDEFNRGITFATIYLLATSGFLELSLHSCSAKMKEFKFRYLSAVDDPVNLVREYQVFVTSIYKKELGKMVLNAFAVLVVVSAVTVGLSWHQSSMMTIEVFFIACFAYSGLLLGLFNKIFIQIEEWKLNAILAFGMAVSLGVSVGLIRFLHSTFWSIAATVLACWSFGLACTIVRYYEHVRAPHYEISIAPHLRSSGQRYIGHKSDWSTRHERDIYVAKLMAERHKFPTIAASSPLGLSIQTAFKKFNNAVELLRGDHPFRLAIADMKHVIEQAYYDFREGKIVVHQVPNALEAAGVPYSALATVEKNSLRIFMTYSRASTEDQTVVVCEAIMHEVIERAGWSHSTACAVEMVLRSVDLMAVQTPVRIRRQVDSSKRLDLKRLIMLTEQNRSRLASLGVNIDQFWKLGQMNHDERLFLVRLAKLWDHLCQNFNKNPQMVYAQIWELVSQAPNTLATTIEKSTNHSGSAIHLQSAIYRSILLSILANEIETRSVEKLHKLEITDPNANDANIIQQIVKVSQRNIHRLHVFAAVFYMAITNDPSFTREVGFLPKIVRPLFCAFHQASRNIFNVINSRVIYRNNPSIRQFLHRAYKGIVRVHYYSYKNNANRVTRIDACDGSYNRVSIVREIDINNNPEELARNGELPPLEVLRFDGAKPVNWTPKDSDKPISKGIFESISSDDRHYSTENYRLSVEYYFDAQQKITKTHLYRYQHPNDVYPSLRYVFDKESPRYWSPENSSVAPIETHFFDKVAGGMVANAILSRNHKKTKQSMLINVKFSYEQEGPGVGPKGATFSSNVPFSWELVVEYAPYPMLDSPTQVWFVRYHKRGEAGFYVTKFDYSHPKHATHHTIYTVDESKLSLAHLEGIPVPTPAEVKDDHFNVMHMIAPTSIFDSSDFIRKNLRRRNFRSCNISWPIFRTQYSEYASTPYDTRKRRDMLWTSWRGGYIPGVFARNLDEQVLRVDPNLSLYWRYRNRGNIEKALEALKEKRQDLNNCLYVADRPASRTRLQLRYSDLAMFGIGGDSHNISAFDQGNSGADDGQETLEVISLDSGTWPTGGGGVGSCRRDLIDSLTRVRWTAIAEISTAELEQMEKHIKAIIYLPIFETDFGNPYENIYRTHNYKDLRERQMRTTDRVIVERFVPLIKQLIEGCLEENLSSDRLSHYENIFISMYRYFSDHDWTTSWNHPATQRIWIVTFLDCASAMHRSKRIMNIETPTLSHISILFTLFSRLLLPLCLNVPQVPVVHVSHHGTQAIQGVIAKAINGSRLVIWDHGMLWRERLFGLCKDGMPAFVQIGFSGLTRLCVRVAYNCADYITPCTSVQNVMWAAWLSGGKYGDDKQSAELYQKCAPVLNGMNLTKFNVKRENALKTPTAVMLSHISPVKDVMNAIKAAYYIVHEFKLSTYQLHIYGSPHKDQAYTLACLSAIAEFRLEKNVFLKGLGNPSAVLQTGWIFVNSSITEGLPLALGEAGLCGLPVVCTDVGGSREVISDMKTGAIYGSVVPPSRPRQLAIGQLQVFAMTDGLNTLSNPATTIPSIAFTDLVSQPGNLEKRIMNPEVCTLRENLGLLLRAKTQSVFSIARYWREHEQILWTGPLYDRIKPGEHKGAGHKGGNRDSSLIQLVRLAAL
ncbi:hypothetical protein HDU76_007253 [Blyttiomyces sp. JEL0837]|nr:hypothetical protein HDU76_007253 [Blyttiomyces sp. JEL0837]